MTSENKKEVVYLAEKKVEVRCFGALKKYADAKGWAFPYYYPLADECSASALAQRLSIPLEEIEGVFIDGNAQPLAGATVKPGARVGFIPYGIPGPYRIMLGFRK